MPCEYITANDIEKVRRRVKVGDRVKCKTYKSSDAKALSARGPVIRYGIVTAKYQYFAVVRLAGGVMDSVLWVDLVKRRKPCID